MNRKINSWLQYESLQWMHDNANINFATKEYKASIYENYN